MWSPTRARRRHVRRLLSDWIRPGLALLLLALVGAVPALAEEAASSGALEGEIAYTRYKGGGENVKKVPFRYDGGSLSLGAPVPLATTDGANGIERAPDGTLLVGSGQDRVHKVTPDGSGDYETVTAGGTMAHHMALDPDGTRVWAGGEPGQPAEIPLAPFGDGTSHVLVGDDPGVSHIIFDGAGRAFYTSGDYEGWGNFGRIDLARFVTRRTLTDVEAAHGLAFDPHTGDLFLFGGSEIVQIDPDQPDRIKSRLRLDLGSQFDVGRADGRGHLFVTRNDGQVVFIDYTRSGLIGDARVQVAYLDSYIDDLVILHIEEPDETEEAPPPLANVATTMPTGGEESPYASPTDSPNDPSTSTRDNPGAAPPEPSALATNTPPPSTEELAAAALNTAAAVALALALALAVRSAGSAPLAAGVMAAANGGLGAVAAYAAYEGFSGSDTAPDLTTAALVAAASLALLGTSSQVGKAQIGALETAAGPEPMPALAGGPGGTEGLDLASDASRLERASVQTPSGPTEGGGSSPSGAGENPMQPGAESSADHAALEQAAAEPERTIRDWLPILPLVGLARPDRSKENASPGGTGAQKPSALRRSAWKQARARNRRGERRGLRSRMGSFLGMGRTGARKPERTRPSNEPKQPTAHLSMTAKEIVAHLRKREPDRNVRVDIAPDLVAPAALETLRPVIRALITQAWQRTTNAANARIRLGATTGPNGPSYFVQDNGEALTRTVGGGWAEPTTNEPGGGRQRLDAARRIVERLGGSLWTEPTPGGGAKVHFDIGKGDAS